MSLFGKEYYVIMIEDYGHCRCRVYVCWANSNEEFEYSRNPNEARMFESAKDAEEFCFCYLDSYLAEDGLDWHVVKLSRAPRGYGSTKGCR